MTMVALALLSSFLLVVKAEDVAQWSSAGWYVQNDGVMGGRSNGELKIDNGANFKGNINMNGGGFASFRRNFGFLGEKDMGSYSGLWVEADVVTEDPLFHVPLAIHLQLGDNSRYTYGAAFAIPSGPAGSTYSVYLPFSWFTKQLLRRCSGCQLNPQRINDLSVYVLYQEGPFNFKIRQIRAVQSSEVSNSAVPSLLLSDEKAWMLVKATIERGSTLWNKGNPELCGAMYHVTAETLASSSNVSSAVVELAQVAMNLAQRYPANWGGEGAWIYRKAFDHMLAAYEGKTPPGDGRYPAVASGSWAATSMNGNSINPLPTSMLMANMQDQIALNSAPQKGLRILLAVTMLAAVQTS